MIIIPNVNKENSCINCPVWSLCWDKKPKEDISKDRCPVIDVICCEDCSYGIPVKNTDNVMCGAHWIKRYKDFFCGEAKVE